MKGSCDMNSVVALYIHFILLCVFVVGLYQAGPLEQVSHLEQTILILFLIYQ